MQSPAPVSATEPDHRPRRVSARLAVVTSTAFQPRSSGILETWRMALVVPS
jgi:hypothetical protein